jgi:hypothetical protein
VFGNSLAPEEITKLLGCQPTEAQRKGDIIPDKQYRRVAPEGSWLLRSGLPKTTSVDEQVVALLAKLTDDVVVWERLTSEFRVDLFCGLFLDEINRVFSLSPHAMQMMSARGIGICFDVYGLAKVRR